MWLVWSTITMKSVIAGEYTAPPAHGPMIAEIWGITPEASVLRRKISAYPPRLATPSWMRAPPLSLSPTTGAPFSMARSISRQILAGVRFAQRSAEHGEVLRERVGQAARHRPVTADHAVAGHLAVGHVEVGIAMADEHAEFLERRRIEQEIDPFAGRQPAGLVDLRDAVLAAARVGLGAKFAQFLDLVVGL